MATLCTSILGFKRKGLVAFGADSRTTNHHYGNKTGNDDTIKIHGVCDGVLGAGAGKGEMIKDVFKEARIHYLTHRPKSVKEAAKHLARQAENVANLFEGRTDLVVAGWVAGDCEMYKISPTPPPTESQGPATTSKRKDMLPVPTYVVEAVDEVVMGRGQRFMKPFLKGAKYEKYRQNASSSFEETRDVIKDAMFNAKKFDYCTDGPLRVVCVLEKGKVLCSTATPTGPAPSDPYGPWTEGDFSPVADVTDNKGKKKAKI